jgi:cell division protein FtsQ
MHQQKGKKILIYFFLLLFVGSINNINLNNLKFKNINNIDVSGLGDVNDAILLQEIKNLNLENIFLLDKKKIINQIESNNVVENYDILKKYPSSLDINIKKTKFLARVNKNGKIFFIGSNGKLIKNNFLNNDLPFIFGSPNIDEFLNFKNIIDLSKISYAQINNLYFFPSKRWDLELKNGTIIRLSNDNHKRSLNYAQEFLYNKELRDIKIIDARIKNQIILNDG